MLNFLMHVLFTGSAVKQDTSAHLKINYEGKNRKLANIYIHAARASISFFLNFSFKTLMNYYQLFV